MLPEAATRTLTALPLPDVITTKTAEGFSLYGLYPETYLEAAGAMDAGRPTRVIGLRSVGAPLAAVVAAGLGVRSAVTLAPDRPPFYREVKLAEALAPKSWPIKKPASPSWTKAPACPAVRSARSRTFWRLAV